MSVKIEEIKNTKFSAKGILTEISEEGFHIEDEKSGDVEVLTMEDIKTLIGKSVVISFSNKEDLE
jgi:hypothetical protein